MALSKNVKESGLFMVCSFLSDSIFTKLCSLGDWYFGAFITSISVSDS